MRADNFQQRVQFIGLAFVLVALASLLRLFYLQVIRHSHYNLLASEGHLRKYQLVPQRGQIYIQNRGQKTPLALNRNLKTLYADPRYIKNTDKVADILSEITGKDSKSYQQALNSEDVYVVLEKQVEPAVAQKIEEQELSGIGLSDNFRREYPEGSLAAHVLGFVNGEGKGQYGVEEYLDQYLSGTPGLLNAKTDTRGIPIATSNNIQIAPVDGDDVVLTIDRNIQAKVEEVLARGMQEHQPKSLSAVVIDPNTGAVKAMANYPTFDPNKYSEVNDYAVFINQVTQGLFEPGSGFKVFSMAAGLNSGAVTPDTTYFDESFVKVDDYTIRNAGDTVAKTRTMTEVITKSVNTGVVFVLRQLGGGSINEQGKHTLYSYLTDKFHFGRPTGIEQPNEPAGTVHKPTEVGDVAYANMTFGQGLSATMMQAVAAMAAAVNGGTLYKPYLVDHTIASNGNIKVTSPTVVAQDIISDQTSAELRAMMETVVESGGGFGTKIEGYRIGGKTGTAQIPNPDGGYFTNRDIGSFTGVAPLDNPQYLMMVRIDEPAVGPGQFAGSNAAGPLFGDIMKWLLTYSGVPPGQ